MKQIFANAGCKPAFSAKVFRPWAFRMLAVLAIIICASTSYTSFGAPLVYVGSTPSNNGIISSFDDIILSFDLSNLIAEYGEAEWGICANATYKSSKPAQQKTAVLYKGTEDEGELLVRKSTIIDWNSSEFSLGSDFHLSFPDIEVIPNQIYTLKITYDMFAIRVGIDDDWLMDSKYSFFANPLILTFVGGENSAKLLKLESSNVEETVNYSILTDIQVHFNYDVSTLDNFQAQIVEGNEVICSAESYSVDASDSKSIVINFPENTLYKGHNYSVEIPEGCISVAGEADVLNSAISIPFKGAAYRELTTGRIRPSNGSTTMMDEIVVPFNFPDGYGFVYVSDDTKYTIQIYKGNGTDGELVETLNATVGDDSKSLIFNPTFDIEPSSEYTLYMPEGSVKAYEIGAMKPTYLEDYISKAVELHYSTIALDELPALTITDCDYQDNEAVEYLGNVDWAGCTYTYAENVYNTSMADYKAKGMLYKVTDGERELVKEVSLTKLRNEEDRIVIRAIVDSYLNKGVNYEIVIPEGTFTVTGSNFLKRYVRNEEAVLTLVGAYRTDFNVTILSSDGHSMETTLPRHQSMTLKFAAAENWAVEDVLHNSESKGAVEEYTIEDLTEDTTIEVKHAYQGNIAFEFTTGVDSIEVDGTNYVVSREGEMIVISGLNKTETIRVYSLGGQMLSSRVADDEVVKISLPAGVYVVTVADGTKEFAFKVML